MIEDRKGLRPRHRQTVDGHFLNPQGLAAFVYFSLLYKSLLFNLEVRPNGVSFNYILAGMFSHAGTYTHQTSLNMDLEGKQEMCENVPFSCPRDRSLHDYRFSFSVNLEY